MPIDHSAIVRELDGLLDAFARLRQQSRHQDCSDKRTEANELITRMVAAIDRYAPPRSQYRERADALMKSYYPNSWGAAMPLLPGVLKALREDFAAGCLQSIQEMIHGDMFSDFLERAAYLLQEGHKDAAAVVGGTVLEQHLRTLCTKHGLPVTDANGARKASALNADLYKSSVYTKGDQMSITAWLNVRNEAAHGHYASYSNAQVDLLINGVRDFINRVPA